MLLQPKLSVSEKASIKYPMFKVGSLVGAQKIKTISEYITV